MPTIHIWGSGPISHRNIVRNLPNCPSCGASARDSRPAEYGNESGALCDCGYGETYNRWGINHLEETNNKE